MYERIVQLSKRGSVVLVDSGDLFFTAPKLNPNRVELEKLKAELIAKSYKQMGLTAFSPGEKDFALGVDALLALVKDAGAELVSANLETSKAAKGFLKTKQVNVGGLNFLITGLTRFDGTPPEGIKVLPPEEELKKVFSKAAMGSFDRAIVLSHLGHHEDEKLANQFPGVFVIGSKSKNIFVDPILAGQSYVFEAGYDGQRLGEVEIQKSPKAFSGAILTELTKEYDKPNAVKIFMDSHFSKLKNLTGGTPLKSDEQIEFVANPHLCKGCHEAQFDFWKNTKHSTAILSLQKKNQHYNPDCIGCHSLAYQSPTGFSHLSQAVVARGALSNEKLVDKILQSKNYWTEIDKIHNEGKLARNFLGVQCEHCHENRAEHVKNPSRKSKGVNTDSCIVCHKPPNAPEFDPRTLNKVACPLIENKRMEGK